MPQQQALNILEAIYKIFNVLDKKKRHDLYNKLKSEFKKLKILESIDKIIQIGLHSKTNIKIKYEDKDK